MTDFSIDIDTAAVAESLNDLEEDWATDAVFTVGSNTEYGVILEMGRGPIEAPEGSAIPIETDSGTIFRKKVSGHPPYPWFRPAIREFQANSKEFILDNTGFNSIKEIPDGDTLVRAIATALENQMKANASAQSASDRSPGTHPEHPTRDSGNLVASISAVKVQ